MANNDLQKLIDSTLDIPWHEQDSPENYRDTFTPNYNLKLIAFNVRSINKNFDSFLVFLHRLSLPFDVIILTECWLNDTTTIDSIPGYTTHYTCHNINQNGGVVVYVNNDWNATVSELYFEEACCLAVIIPNVAVILGMYRSPSFSKDSNMQLFLKNLGDTLKLYKDHENITLAGDINIDLVENDKSKIDPNDYLCLLSEHGLLPVIYTPTRINTCLDHIFIKTKFPAIGGVCDTDITDHKILLLGVETKKVKTKPSRIM